jgi:hypothetical protein
MIKKEKKVKAKGNPVGYSSVHQKIARQNSGNTITAKAFIKFAKELEKGLKGGTESQCKK